MRGESNKTFKLNENKASNPKTFTIVLTSMPRCLDAKDRPKPAIYGHNRAFAGDRQDARFEGHCVSRFVPVIGHDTDSP